MSVARAHAPSAWRAAGALLLALAASGCHVIGATAYNLDQLHASDGRHKRTGDIVTPFSYLFTVGLRGVFKGLGAQPEERPVQAIEDPTESCIEQLNDLASFDPAERGVGATQVVYFARLAVFDAWNLSREISVRELGKAGVRLQLAEHSEAAPSGAPATVEQVRAGLKRLIDATASFARSPEDEAARAEFDASCRALGELPLDLEGATRVLRAAAVVEMAVDASQARFAAARELSLTLQRRCVNLALEHALTDAPPGEHAGSDPGWDRPRVRAAAVTACVRVWGAPKLAQFLTDYLPRATESERAVALLKLVAARGLPEPPAELPAEERARRTAEWTRAIVALATSSEDGTLRLAAMGALGTISGQGRFSLREEDWQRWWSEQNVAAGPALPPAGALQP